MEQLERRIDEQALKAQAMAQEKDLWVRVWVTLSGVIGVEQPETATRWADKAVSDYRDRWGPSGVWVGQKKEPSVDASGGGLATKVAP
jgi:hypothetical protein